jgi:hypothetical protein
VLHRLIVGLDEEMAGLGRTTLGSEAYERYCAWLAARAHHGAAQPIAVRVPQALCDRLAQVQMPSASHCRLPPTHPRWNRGRLLHMPHM